MNDGLEVQARHLRQLGAPARELARRRRERSGGIDLLEHFLACADEPPLVPRAILNATPQRLHCAFACALARWAGVSLPTASQLAHAAAAFELEPPARDPAAHDRQLDRWKKLRADKRGPSEVDLAQALVAAAADAQLWGLDQLPAQAWERVMREARERMPPVRAPRAPTALERRLAAEASAGFQDAVRRLAEKRRHRVLH